MGCFFAVYLKHASGRRSYHMTLLLTDSVARHVTLCPQ